MENNKEEITKEYEKEMVAMAKRQQAEHDAKVAAGAFVTIVMTFILVIIGIIIF